MFTGIIKEMGIVRRFDNTGDTYALEILAGSISKDVDIGDSVAVNGVCLTATGIKKDILCFDVMAETIRRTMLVNLKNNDEVNLEGSLKADGKLGGHFVQGHIDCVGDIRAIKKTGNEFSIEVSFPGEFSRLVVEKGSVAVDGISLTVGETAGNSFKLHIIPHTLKSTTLGRKRVADKVNIEFDIIGKYIARFGETGDRSRVTEEFLRQKGF